MDLPPILGHAISKLIFTAPVTPKSPRRAPLK
jgi:hypothetical protein